MAAQLRETNDFLEKVTVCAGELDVPSTTVNVRVEGA